MVKFVKKLIQKTLTRRSFRKEFFLFKRLSEHSKHNLSINWSDKYPCLFENTSSTAFDGHYVYHTAWAARILNQTRPTLHVDISSSLYFCSMVSAFIPVEYYDYRPPRLQLDNLDIKHADITSLPFKNDSVKSLSCMHVAEHIGLGRYGDPLDPEGDIKAIDELKRVLSPAGDLLLVVPIGIPKIMFNAHRIYSYDQIVENFNKFKLIEFALIPDDYLNDGIIRNAQAELTRTQNYGCGCFWFKKLQRCGIDRNI